MQKSSKELALKSQFAFNQPSVLIRAKEPDLFWKLWNSPVVLWGPPRILDVCHEFKKQFFYSEENKK